ncbi:MAG: redoxin domain-containing protein [Bacteroidales bacterium]|jgi:thiol-disulfide isomerase/thioredoxin|nr:redoxin domain-containing protein [Bacteroidales bacterium]
MKSKYFIWVTITFLFYSCSSIGSPYPIQFRIDGFPQQTIYIAQIEGDAYAIIDTLVSGEKGIFRTEFNNTQDIGMYAFIFPQLQNLKIPFIFNKEPQVSFSSEIFSLQQNVHVEASEENKAFYTFSQFYTQFTEDISQLETFYETYSRSEFLSKIEKEYENRISEEELFTRELLKQYKNTFASHVITASRKAYSAEILFSNEKYEYEKKHFFDNINFSDTTLLYTNILTKKSIEYLTLCSQKRSREKPYKALQDAVMVIINKALPYPRTYDFIINYLLTGFESMGDETMMKFVSEVYLEDKQCSSENATTLERKALQNSKLTIGSTIPTFRTQTLQKSTISSEKFADKSMQVIIFWSTSCGHCQEMIPDIAKYMKQHQSVNSIFISLDQSQKVLKDFVDSHPSLAKHHLVCDEKGWDGKLAKAFYVYATPTIFIVENNKIISKPLDFETFKRDIYSLTNTK